ncbi:peptide-methionine (S)-S-oxide reductase MsrA [Paenibacillus sp. N4]|uniref:peptide-methionine (S)-S-oxide reductase MsrA n=1 Tax=Paenibacillus vietnamensis TaxID=2590547 RepID=UPI001CD176D3|nr:peptide-methionine (S)-S-oxide reductase MsrA [Paenibacillus vietnamensis]MCA0756590.1 peptide-methionine (S)-S-oxide reductase MsrA [Paenibacillus vietnamensis]
MQKPHQTVTLGMGCFWSPEALFGHLPGVLRTQTGYAGGTTPDPVYRSMGDHTETVQVTFDPELISLQRLLHVFWDNHNPVNINGYKGRQYQSLVLYSDDEQLDTAREVIRERAARGKGEPATELAPLSVFYPAEDRHQKYYLKRFPDAMEKLAALYPQPDQLHDSAAAARLNGLAKGCTSLERILRDIRDWPADWGEKERIIEAVRQIKW